MPKGRGSHPSEQHSGNWFAHTGVCQSQPESTTSSAQKQVRNSRAARSIEDRLPLAYRAREQGMGRRKVEPERRQQNSQNFFLWAQESVSSREDCLTIYQTSFMKEQTSKNPFGRRSPEQHSEKCHTEKPIPEEEKTLQPTKSS
ncbi:testis-expressed protein 36 isoform 2-T2 [Porphyrio hochstetteri]